MTDEPDAVTSAPSEPSGPWAEYALAKPGAWADQPWEGDHVAKVGEKIFCFLGSETIGVKCGTRAEADEWLAEYPDDASVMAYIGRHGLEHPPGRWGHPRRRAPRGGRHLLRPRRRRPAQAPATVRLSESGRTWVDVVAASRGGSAVRWAADGQNRPDVSVEWRR